MPEITTLGTWLRRERERRGVTLSQIAEDTKVSVPLLEGLEADDLSRWPGGIFRRSFARSYAAAVGLDPDLVVKRIEEEHPDPAADPVPAEPAAPRPTGSSGRREAAAPIARRATTPRRTRLTAAALDLLVACAIGLSFAAAESRLLWPVIAIAIYHALGVLLAGTTPMTALLATDDATADATARREPVAAQPATPAEARRPDAQQRRPRHSRRGGARQAPVRSLQ